MPRRRRRFFALGEDRFQLEPPVEKPGSFDPESLAPSDDDQPDASADAESGGETGDDQPFAVRPRQARRLNYWRRVPFPLVVGLVVLSAALGGLATHLLSVHDRRLAGSRLQQHTALLTPDEQNDLDAAYTARGARRLDEAEQLFTALGRKHPDWTAMQIELGRTLLYRRNYLGARAALNDAASQGAKAAEANLLIGTAFDAEKSWPEAEASFAQAVALDPTQADAYFLWAECLRGQGKLTDAIARYRSALLRNQDDTGAGLYRLKLWLCEIEVNQADDTTNAEINAALARPFPPMEALFAAAARDLKARDLKAAAVHLVRARERADPQIFMAVLSDPFFVQARSTPELSAMIRSVSPAASPAKTE